MTRNKATRSSSHFNSEPAGRRADSQGVTLRSPERGRPLSRSRGRLASARDRQRLREREFAERARVEEMLASAPPLSPLLSERPLPKGPARLRALPVHASTCPVCTSTKVVRDEVMSGGLLRLSECLHCDHRWTDRPRSRAVLAPAHSVVAEVAPSVSIASAATAGVPARASG